MPAEIITIERHILEQERLFPEATGELTNLLYDIALAAKIIGREVSKAGLVEILGLTGEENIQGEQVMKLDVYANDTLVRMNEHTGRLCVMASEEVPDLIPIPDEYPCGRYVLIFDPLDGSSNIDMNVSIGTIFSIQRKVSGGPYTTGQGVHGFTLDPSVGEFLLSHPNIQTPSRAKYYSVNEGNYGYWSEGVRRYVDYLKASDKATGRPYSGRYIGSLVADFHRNLLAGGIFMYPADTKDPKKPHGKLRLLYEAAPLAFIIEQAGGRASDSRQDIMQVQPESLHQRVPLFIGSKEDVDMAEEFICEFG
jgi:fructose-1,6-bisphosphatase I